MTIQYATPLLIHQNGTSERLERLPLNGDRGAKSTYDEAWLTKLLFKHPEILPIREIDSVYANPIPVCTELNTRVGLIDVLYLTSSGRLVIAEAKLWRNPQARREVVGQILDYAAELSRWTYSDLEREVAKRRGPGELFGVVAAAEPDLDEADFVDSVSRSLRDGRFLLLVCGDGIREELRGIAEFLRRSTTLHLTFGIVELAIFATSRGERLVQPRVLAKTAILDRWVVRLDGSEARIEEDVQDELDAPPPERSEREKALLDFWTELAGSIRFDDPSQQPPKPSVLGNVSLRMPSPRAWITLYFSKTDGEMGVFLTFNRGEPGDTFYQRLLEEREQIAASLPRDVEWDSDGGRHRIGLKNELLSITHPVERVEALRWFSKAANLFVNVFRPRIARYQEEL